MTFKQLALEITKREGKKKQVDIAQVSEVLARLVDIVAEDPNGVLVFLCDQAKCRPFIDAKIGFEKVIETEHGTYSIGIVPDADCDGVSKPTVDYGKKPRKKGKGSKCNFENSPS